MRGGHAGGVACEGRGMCVWGMCALFLEIVCEVAILLNVFILCAVS